MKCINWYEISQCWYLSLKKYIALFHHFPRTIRIGNILPAALVHASTIAGLKNRLHKEFLSGNMYVVSPKGQYDRPRLGSSASLPVVGPVYWPSIPLMNIGMHAFNTEHSLLYMLFWDTFTNFSFQAAPCCWRKLPWYATVASTGPF